MEYQCWITVGDSLEVSQHVGCTEEHGSRVCDIPADSLSEGMSGTLIENTTGITVKTSYTLQSSLF